MRMSKPFVVYKRTLKSGKSSYYYYARLPDGTRSGTLSTGQKTKSAAERYCAELYRKGELIPKPVLKFSDFAETWWDWERCDYIKRQIRTRGRFSPSYAASQRSILLRYLKPCFGNKGLVEITTGDIEKWRASLIDEHHLSQLSANHVLATLKVMLGEATRCQLIPYDPSSRVAPYQSDSREKGILELADAQKLFSVKALEEVWENDKVHYVINMVAMLGGLRQGEILSLKMRDLQPKGVLIANSWDRQVKQLVLPKNGKKRFVPLPEIVLELLKEVADKSVPTEEGYLFPNALGTAPLDHKVLNKRLYNALGKIEISREQCLAKNITFNSWRHFANTHVRAMAGDLIARTMIGHSDEGMQDHYTHAKKEDNEVVIKAQLKLLGRVA